MDDKDEVHASPSGKPNHRHAANTRRTFMGNALKGLAILVPALRVLVEPSSVPADPPSGWCSGHCTRIYVVYTGHECVCGRLIGYYNNYCSKCGSYCSSWQDDEGPC